MINLQAVNVGPIVGETTPHRVRLRGRGSYSGSPMIFVHGVARVLKDGNELNIVFFKMTATWDYTGVGIFEDLAPNTEYDYQLAYFYHPADTSELGNFNLAFDWEKQPTYKFTTASDDSNESRSYLVGSCRYNLPWSDDEKDHTDTRGDKTFKRMLTDIKSDPAHGLIMLGDQIYADILGSGVAKVSSFHRLYRGAYRQESLREVMSKVPTYMTLDDHEIEDNWPEGKSPDDYHKFNSARYAYQAYQAAHSPLLAHRDGRLDGLPDRFWYEFSDGCAEFFMLDVRTERDIEDEEIINEYQMDGLLAFLKRDSGLVKIVGSAVPFFPDGGDDKWSGFKDQRNKILKFIQQNKIEKVVFISGDVHFSAIDELRCSEDPKFKIYSITCSPFFWPFPHWTRLKYKKIRAGGLTFKPKSVEDPYRSENYVRLNIHPDKIDVEIVPRNKYKDPVKKTIQL